MAKEKEIGEVLNYFDHVGAASVRLSGKLTIGDKIKIKGGDFEFEQEVKNIQLDRKDVPFGKAGDEIGIITNQKVRKGYRVYKL
jgi:translation elongation factor EF-1alpha